MSKSTKSVEASKPETKTPPAQDKPKTINATFLGKSLLTLAFFNESGGVESVSVFPKKSFSVPNLPSNLSQLNNYKKMNLVKF